MHLSHDHKCGQLVEEIFCGCDPPRMKAAIGCHMEYIFREESAFRNYRTKMMITFLTAVFLIA